MRICAILLLLIGVSPTISAQHWFVSQKLGTVPVIGLLDLPDVTERYSDDECRSTEAKGVQVFATPSKPGAVMGIVYKRNHPEYGCTLLLKRAGASAEEELPTDESGYETPAAVVYERRERWFRIAVPGGSGWIERASDEGFLAYPIFIVGHMAYLREDWDGQLRPNPGEMPAVAVPADWKAHIGEPLGIEVLGVRRVGGEDWMQVRFATDRCGDDRFKMMKPLQGWVPAYRRDGATTAWFYSRGC